MTQIPVISAVTGDQCSGYIKIAPKRQDKPDVPPTTAEIPKSRQKIPISRPEITIPRPDILTSLPYITISLPDILTSRGQNLLQSPEPPTSKSEIPTRRPDIQLFRHGIEISKPDIPKSQPEIPISRPDIPISRPEIPISIPDIPISQPEIPISRPDIPLSQLEIPISKPYIRIPIQDIPKPDIQTSRLEQAKRRLKYAKDDLVLVSSCYLYRPLQDGGCPCVTCLGHTDSNLPILRASHIGRGRGNHHTASVSRNSQTTIYDSNSRLLQHASLVCYRNCQTPLQHCVSDLKMCRTLRRMLFLCVFVSCFVYIIGKLPGSRDTEEESSSHIHLGGPDSLVLKSSMYKSVPLKAFETNIQRATSHFDVIRMFLRNQTISNERLTQLINKDDKYTDLDKRDYDEFVNDDDYYTDDDDTMMQKAWDHFEEMKNGPFGQCSQPRPEVVRVRDITGDAHKMYFPKFTVLHKCRNITGCCWNESQECRPHAIQIVWRAFFVLSFNAEDDNVELLENSVDWVLFENHTRCSCQDLNPLPACTSRCPHPFFMSRPDEECICDCKDNSLECNKIKYGMTPLGTEEFECVKQGECMEPLCVVGQFDKRKGYCPGVEHKDIKILHLLQQEKHKRPGYR